MFFKLYFQRHYCIKGNCRHLTTYNAYNLCTFLGLIVIERWKQPDIVLATSSTSSSDQILFSLSTKRILTVHEETFFWSFWTFISFNTIRLQVIKLDVFKLFNVMHGKIKSIYRICIFFIIFIMESILNMNFYAWEWLDCSIAHVSMQICNNMNILQIEESTV